MASDESEKGKIKIKTDRIIDNLDDEDIEVKETELDKSFPELFDDITTKQLKAYQVEEEQSINELKHLIFEEEEELNKTSLYDIKDELFDEDYTATTSTASDEKDEDSSNSISNIIFYGSLAVFIGMIGSGVVIVLRKWNY